MKAASKIYLPEVFENIIKGNKILETTVCPHWNKYTYNIPHFFLISAVTAHSIINSANIKSSQGTLYSPECQELSLTRRAVPNKVICIYNHPEKYVISV